MTFQPTDTQITDLRQRLELVYGRRFDDDEARQIAQRLFNLYDELKTIPQSD